MPISSVGKTDLRRGVTLIEMLVVVAIIGIMIAITLPSASAGLDSVRLNSATGEVASFLNSASNLAQRHQSPVEVTIAVHGMEMIGVGVDRHLKLPEGIILAAEGGDPNGFERDSGGKLLLMPGAPAPAMGFLLTNAHGVKRTVQLDPMTGFPRIGGVEKK